MIYIEKIKLIDFIQLPEDERNILEIQAKYYEREAVDCTQFKFIDVKELQLLLHEEQTYATILNICAKGCTLNEDLLKANWHVALTLYHSIIEAITSINEMEVNNLGGYVPSAKEISAGIDVFEKYSFYNQVRSVAIELHLHPKEVEAMEWNRVFTELCYQKDSREFMRNLNKSE